MNVYFVWEKERKRKGEETGRENIRSEGKRQSDKNVEINKSVHWNSHCSEDNWCNAVNGNSSIYKC